MGQRVAELTTPGCAGTVGYIVYQSTAMACFTPIFGDQLAAELFASLLSDIYPDWSDKAQEKLSDRVNSFVRGKFGEAPEDHDDYLDFLCDDRKQKELLEELRIKPAA